jgi:hypothetical protein
MIYLFKSKNKKLHVKHEAFFIIMAIFHGSFAFASADNRNLKDKKAVQENIVASPNEKTSCFHRVLAILLCPMATLMHGSRSEKTEKERQEIARKLDLLFPGYRMREK